MRRGRFVPKEMDLVKVGFWEISQAIGLVPTGPGAQWKMMEVHGDSYALRAYDSHDTWHIPQGMAVGQEMSVEVVSFCNICLIWILLFGAKVAVEISNITFNSWLHEKTLRCDVGWRPRCEQTNPTPHSTSSNKKKKKNNKTRTRTRTRTTTTTTTTTTNTKHNKHNNSSSSKNTNTQVRTYLDKQTILRNISETSALAQFLNTVLKNRTTCKQASKQVKWLSKPTRKEEGRMGLKKQIRTIKEPKNRTAFWSFW